MMKLRELLNGLDILETNAELDSDIREVRYDSRLVESGDLFIAVTGAETDGHKYIPMAREKGAACVLCERAPEGGAPFVRVADSRRALAVVGGNRFDHPAREMTMIGITGTSGKTTSTYLIKSILEQKAGAKVGLIGTIQNMIGSEVLHTERTTPESFELQKLLRRMSDAGCTHAVMEVSSHALVLDRVYGIHFAVGIFTNLSQDHLDFHRTMEEYCDAKAILFDRCDVGVYNADDPWHTRLLQNATCPRKFSYAIHADADLKAKSVQLHPGSVAFDVEADTEWAHVQVGIPAQFTVYNALTVMGIAKQLGISLTDCAAALKTASGVKGRVEVVPTPGKDYTILIDYAHTPDSMVNVLQTVKEFAKGRTVAVFGCGGDRDKTKRPRMGKAAADWSDFAVVTTDNPRTEEPAAIIRDILSGVKQEDGEYIVIEDRRAAIRYAMDIGKKDDIIILAGKGHETYQDIGGVKRHLDEREEVAAHLREKEETAWEN